MRLTDQEIQRAFAISKDTPLWKAIIQMLEDYREQAVDAAAGYVATEKPYSTAGAIGQAELAKKIAEDFSELREAATQD
jgi:hypothetical protein